ncbi:hypothetical protein BDZ89DRAFT_212398 [Hymenopellis radicata]|nr:hypothetical protein BDZ89DRAFT_212398 [Hymenopellis radicata]
MQGVHRLPSLQEMYPDFLFDRVLLGAIDDEPGLASVCDTTTVTAPLVDCTHSKVDAKNTTFTTAPSPAENAQPLFNCSTVRIPAPPRPKVHICEICGYSCSRPSNLKVHMHVHTRVKPYVCPYPTCGSTFNVRSNMLRHCRSHGAEVASLLKGRETR